jgi:glucose-6-phosphate 1-dehydrogenase
LKIIPPRLIPKYAVRGQYDGYLEEQGVKPGSRTETYFRVEARVNNSRWRNTPFFLETGKAMAESKTEIDVYFKPKAENSSAIWAGKRGSRLFARSRDYAGIKGQNILTFRIQPDEGIKIRFFVKTPGYEFKIEPKILKFKYADAPSFSVLLNDYERLIHDAFLGDQTLFVSTDEIMASWKFIMPIIENLNKIPAVKYPRGAKEI